MKTVASFCLLSAFVGFYVRYEFRARRDAQSFADHAALNQLHIKACVARAELGGMLDMLNQEAPHLIISHAVYTMRFLDETCGAR